MFTLSNLNSPLLDGVLFLGKAYAYPDIASTKTGDDPRLISMTWFSVRLGLLPRVDERNDTTDLRAGVENKSQISADWSIE